jgi:glycine/D-amino acid oxidase-like deaminating enzyme
MDWGYRVRHLTPREVERLEPDLLLGSDVHEVVFYPDESFIFPPIYLSCLLRAARARGATLRFNEEVVGIAAAGGRVSGVVVRSGTELPADVVICCCGRWTPHVLRFVGAALPLVSPALPGSAAVGLLVRTTPVVADVRRVIHPPGLAMRPDGGGHLLLHGDAHDRAVTVDMRMSPPPPAAAGLLEAVRPVVRYMQHTRVESATVGIRPLPVDGVSVVGWVPTVEGLYVIVTHSGVTLAPILAELAAREVHGSVEARLAPFRPHRFTT